MPETDSRSLRSCLGRFATGVTVVTYSAEGQPRGATVSSFTSISLQPPLILVSIGRGAKACELLRDKPFCVNVLSAHQIATALTFAGQSGGVAPEWVNGQSSPRLRQSHAWLECTPWQSQDAGDHVIFLGEVQEFAFDESEPLLFYSGAFHARGDDLSRISQVAS
ncbi:MAG: flavin reductase family protein [Actinomycetota bacterium]|nr:flavin reductase family protein [Actinomycetota bacterium]